MLQHSEDLPASRAVLEHGVELKWHHSAEAVAATADGRWYRVVVGDTRPRSDGSRTAEPLWPWLCAAKPVLSLSVARLVERGDLDFDDPVASVIPEFAANGKDGVTIEHVLLHMSGFKNDPIPVGSTLRWDEAMEVVYKAPLEPGWVPGVHGAYQMYSFWYLLGEILMRVTGADLATVLRRSVLDPLGMTDTWVGVAEDAYRARVAHRTVPLVYNRPDIGIVGPIDFGKACLGQTVYAPHGRLTDLIVLYWSLLRPDTAEAVVDPRMLAEVTRPRRVGVYDHEDGRIVDYSACFQLESRRYRRTSGLYGRHASPLAFGHGGGLHMAALCDPAKGVAMGYVTDHSANDVVAHLLLRRSVLRALYEDLGAG